MIDPVEYSFKVYQGQTLKQEFVVWNDTAQTSAFDFTGYTVASFASASHDSTVTINLNPTISTNYIYLNATPAQLQSFIVLPNNKSSKYFYDIKLTKPDTTIWMLARGVIEIFPEVS